MSLLLNLVMQMRKWCRRRRQSSTGNEDTGFLDTWLQTDVVVVNAQHGMNGYADDNSLQQKTNTSNSFKN